MGKQHHCRIEIIGDSQGGLFTGIPLLSAGYAVYILEKKGKELQDRGAGIVPQQELINFFQKHKIVNFQKVSSTIKRYVLCATFWILN